MNARTGGRAGGGCSKVSGRRARVGTEKPSRADSVTRSFRSVGRCLVDATVRPISHKIIAV